MAGILLRKVRKFVTKLLMRSASKTAGLMYDNTILTLTTRSTPDPFVVRSGERYYFTFTAGNRIEIWCSRSLVDLESAGSKHVVWTPPDGTDHSADIWAPELHCLRGRWYVYYTAAHPSHGNKSHRMFVLGGPPASEDPCQGPWEFLGRIRGLPDQWAIDGTVFELDDSLYFAYSGWPLNNAQNSDLIQELFITKLEDPTTTDGAPVMICHPNQHWEITRDSNGDHGIIEGPQFLNSPDGGWKGLVYSCAGSWTPEYKMATLRYTGGDPLDALAWHKGSEPLIVTRDPIKGPWGPGHGSFLNIGGQVAAIFHATDSPTDGWDNRKARVQRVIFTNGGPFMGYPSGTNSKLGVVSRLKQKVFGYKDEDTSREDNLKALLSNW